MSLINWRQLAASRHNELRQALKWPPVAAATLLSACATPQAALYNPANLGTDQAEKLGLICRDVMGFKPSASLVDNAWPGDPDPASETNGYRGCVATLSRSLLLSAGARAEVAADRDCRAAGLTLGSSALAECVLRGVQAATTQPYLHSLSLTVTPFDVTQRPKSSAPVSALREQQACVEIGLEPEGELYARCIRGLDDVMTAMLLGKDYQN